MINLNEISCSNRLDPSNVISERTRKRKLQNSDTINKRVCLASSDFEINCKKNHLRGLGSKSLTESEKSELAKFVIWRQGFSQEKLNELEKKADSLFPLWKGRTKDFIPRVFQLVRYQGDYKKLSAEDCREIDQRISDLRVKIENRKKEGIRKHCESARIQAKYNTFDVNDRSLIDLKIKELKLNIINGKKQDI